MNIQSVLIAFFRCYQGENNIQNPQKDSIQPNQTQSNTVEYFAKEIKNYTQHPEYKYISQSFQNILKPIQDVTNQCLPNKFLEVKTQIQNFKE